jgi:hypothetical protein
VREWLEGDMNFTLVLYKIDRQKTNNDDVYGEALKGGIQFLPPIEFKGLVKIEAPIKFRLRCHKIRTA